MPRSKTLRDLRREDAAAIVGDELASRLYEKEGDDTGQRLSEQDGLVYRTTLEGEEGDVMVSADKGATWEPVQIGARSGVPFAAAPLNDRGTAWDAGAARQRIWEDATAADGTFDAAKARKAFAIYDSANPENKTAMSLPHHDIEDGKFITQQRGVIACAGVCQGARGGFKEFQDGDTDAAKAHVGKHYAQMKMTAPWETQKSNLRHRAEELWTVEAMPDLYEEGALLAATAALKADLAAGVLPKPSLEEARAMFEGADEFGEALLRAIDPDPGAALRSILSDPQALAPAPEVREGRRVKGEMLKQLETAVGALGDFLGWAKENLSDDKPAPARVAPDVSFRAVLKERFDGAWAEPDADTAPDDSIMEELAEESVIDGLYQAVFVLMDIIVANIDAEPDLPMPQQLDNVQKALNEFAQIVNQGLAAAAQAGAQSSVGHSTDGDGIKPDGADGGTVNPPPGEPDAAALAVDETLDAIRALARAETPDMAEAQTLLDALGERLTSILTRPAAQAGGGTEAILASLLERVESMQRSIEQLTAGQAGAAPPSEPALLAPRRNSAVLPPPRRAVRPLGLVPQEPLRRPGDPISPRDFARDARQRTGFNPYD